MRIIIQLQIKLLTYKYGDFLLIGLLYQLGIIFFRFTGIGILSLIAWELISRGYLMQPVFEQLAVVFCFLLIFILKKEHKSVLIPCINRLTTKMICSYSLVRDVFSWYNFILFPIVIPLLYSANTKTQAISISFYSFLCLWLMGLFLSLLTNVINYLYLKYKLFAFLSMSLLLFYCIVLVLFHQTIANFSYSNLLGNSYFILFLLAGIILMSFFYSSILKQKLYQLYEGNPNSFEAKAFNMNGIPLRNFVYMLTLKHLRCRLFYSFLLQMVSYALAGIFIIVSLGLKTVGFGILLSVYSVNVLPFTIYLSSTYFDGLHTWPVSIKQLLYSTFYIHIIVTSFVFSLLLIWVILFDSEFILSLVSLYFFTLGPVALILFSNILFAQRTDLFPSQLSFSVEHTFFQKTTRFFFAVSLLACSTVIHFFPTIGSSVVLLVSLVTVFAYPYWMTFLYEKFKHKKYYIMECLR